LGPYYCSDRRIRKSKELAPASELKDPELAVLLVGQVLGKDCRGIDGAIVEVWHAGPHSANYTFLDKDTPTCVTNQDGTPKTTTPTTTENLNYEGNQDYKENPDVSTEQVAGESHTEELWYRGKQKTNADGRYEFKTSFPVIYHIRPILHYHFKVTAKETEFVTQAYFKDKVPKRYEDMVKKFGGFAKVKATKTGREITYNIRLNL